MYYIIEKECDIIYLDGDRLDCYDNTTDPKKLDKKLNPKRNRRNVTVFFSLDHARKLITLARCNIKRDYWGHPKVWQIRYSK